MPALSVVVLDQAFQQLVDYTVSSNNLRKRVTHRCRRADEDSVAALLHEGSNCMLTGRVGYD